MSVGFSDLLDSIIRHRGVLGCVLAEEADGILIDSSLQHGVRAAPLAALGASLYRKARLSAAAAGLGNVNLIGLEAERGYICVAGHGDLVLVVLADRGASVGLLRAAMRKAAESLA